MILLWEIKQPSDASIIARKILTAVTGSDRFDQHDVQLMADMGLSTYLEDGLDAETLMKNADTAMYEVEADVRNGSAVRFRRRVRHNCDTS